MVRKVTAAVLLAGFALIGSPADAHISRIASRIRHRSTAFEGDVVVKLGGVVTSKRDKCLSEREVTAYRGNVRYGGDLTDANGAWEIEDEAASGQYRFTVHPKKLPAEGPHSHICDKHTILKFIGVEEEE